MTESKRVTTLSHRHLLPVGEALLTALIWSSSFIGVKVVLRYTGPLTTAGLRYFLAFLFLFPWLWQKRRSSPSLHPTAVVALCSYGALSVHDRKRRPLLRPKDTPGNHRIPRPVPGPNPVLLLGIIRLKERPRPLQLLALTITLGGSVLFFSPSGLELREPLALGLLGVAILSFSAFPVLAREVARGRQVDNITLTGIPLGIGGGLLLLLAAVLEGIPHMPPFAWGVILGLAVVNTLLAYLLYNHALQDLTAIEANVMLNLTPLGTAVIAWGALGERLVPIQIVAMFLVVVGASLMQWKKGRDWGKRG